MAVGERLAVGPAGKSGPEPWLEWGVTCQKNCSLGRGKKGGQAHAANSRRRAGMKHQEQVAVQTARWGATHQNGIHTRRYSTSGESLPGPSALQARESHAPAKNEHIMKFLIFLGGCKPHSQGCALRGGQAKQPHLEQNSSTANTGKSLAQGNCHAKGGYVKPLHGSSSASKHSDYHGCRHGGMIK